MNIFGPSPNHSCCRAVGDEFATNRFGLRTVVRRHFTYKSSAPSSNVTDLIVDIICE